MTSMMYDKPVENGENVIETKDLLYQLEVVSQTELFITSLNHKLNSLKKKLHNIQYKCNHPVVIRYGERFTSTVYKDDIQIGGYYCCLHCGLRNLRVIYSQDKVQEQTVLEYLSDQNDNPELKIQEVIKLYKGALSVLPNKSNMEQLLAKLKTYGIRNFKATVIEF